MKIYLVYNLFSNNPIMYAGSIRAKAKDIAIRHKGSIQIWEEGTLSGRLVLSRGKWHEFDASGKEGCNT